MQTLLPSMGLAQTTTQFLSRRWALLLTVLYGLLAALPAQAQNGPVCDNYANKTTANGLGANGLAGVYVVGTTVYAATNAGLSISTDGGYSFMNKTNTDGLGNTTVNGVYAVGTTVYAATSGGVSISTDGGTTFTNKTTANGLGNNTVNSVYAVGSTVYAATNGGLSISTDGGSTFTNKTTTNGLGNNAVKGVYALGATVYAATAGGLSISTDGGNTFINKTTTDGLGSNSTRWVYAVAGSAGSATVYTATDGGLSISTDGGNTFANKTATNGLNGSSVLGVYALGTTVYATTNSGLNISTDGGNSFTTKTTTSGLGNNLVFGVYATESTIYAATFGGLSFCPSTPAITTGTITGTAMACTGTASGSQSFTVAGSGLLSNISVAAPTDFEVSLNATTGFASSLTLTQSNRAVGITTVYVRTAATALVGSHSGNVTLTTTGTPTPIVQTVAVSGTVTDLPTVSITANPSLTIANGSSTTLTAAGATSYIWNGGSTTASLSASLAGTYSVTGTTAGCKASASVTVTVTGLPLSVTAVASQSAVCVNIPFSVSATVSGGQPPYQYNWSQPGTATTTGSGSSLTAVISTDGVGVQTFQVQVYDATNALVTSNVVSVTVNAPPSVLITASPSLTIASSVPKSTTATAITGIPCKLTATGATTYKWSTAASTSAISTTVAGTYSVTGTTAGCSATASAQVVVVPASPFDRVYPCGYTGNWYPNYLFYHVDGTNSYTFAPGETIYSFGADAAGICKSPSSINPIYPILPSVAKVIAPNALYANYVTSSTHTGGGYGYVDKTCQPVGPLQYLAGSEQKFSIDTPGDYLITFTNGTTRTLTISATAVPATSPYSVTMLSAALPDGMLSLTAVPGSTDLLGDVTGLLNGGTPATQHAYYQWLAGGNVLTQTLALSTNSYVVSSPIWGQTYQVKIRTAGENMYSYTSSPPDPCGVPTADGIIVSSGFTVPYPSAQISSATACAGSTLSLSANVLYGTAPYSYTWVAPPGITLGNPNASPTTATIDPGVSGVQTFTVTIMDSAPTPQVSTITVSVTVVSPLTITATPSLTATAGQSVTLTASDGPTSYQWSDGSSGTSLTVNPTSTTAYSVTGTFANGCLVTATAQVTVASSPLAVTATASQYTVCANVPFLVSFTVTGGQPPYDYMWNQPDAATTTGDGNTTTAVIGTRGLGEQTFQVIVTDANNTVVSSNVVSVTVVAPPTVTISANPSLTVATGQSVTLTASGADAFLWNTGQTTASLSVTTTGAYSVTGTTTAGCSATATANVTQTTLLGPDLTANLTLPDGNFPNTPGAAKDLVMSLFEVGGLPTSAGNITITLTAPLGYTLVFDQSLTSINVSGGNTTAVDNANWQVSNNQNGQQLSLTIKAGKLIPANGKSVVGFSVVRTSANAGSVANLTVNINDDTGKTYDLNTGNNIYVRILNGL